jgi:hypothetical protein
MIKTTNMPETITTQDTGINTTQNRSIDFEKDQQDLMKKTDNIQSLADQVERLELCNDRIADIEADLKMMKNKRDHISGEVIPTMMSEMGFSELTLKDQTKLKVSTSYKAHISEANKEMAFNWLRENGLGDIIKNEISVSFGRNEDNKAADYAELAKSSGFQPTQKMKVEPMTLKALVRERLESGKEMPTEIFGVFTENKTTIKRSK